MTPQETKQVIAELRKIRSELGDIADALKHISKCCKTIDDEDFVDDLPWESPNE